MSWAASLPGQNFSPGNRFCLKKPLVPGSFAAWGRTFFSRNSIFLEETTCPGQLRCLGQNFSQKICFFLKKQLVLGSFAAWGRTFSRKLIFVAETTCPGQLRCLGQYFFSKTDLFVTNHLSWAPALPGAELLLKKTCFFGRSQLVPGSFAAWGRTFPRKSIFSFEEATCPGQLRCLGQFSLRNPTFY